MTLVQLYEVWYTRSGKPECYAKGLTLDNAQTLAAALTSAGTITLARTGSDGFQGGTTTTQAISNVRVERAVKSGDSDVTYSTVTTAITPVSGQTIYALPHAVDLNHAMTVTVEGSSTRPDVLWKLLNYDEGGTNVVMITVPFLTGTEKVSATYSYQTVADEQTATNETATGTPNGTLTTFTSAKVYKPGSLTVVTSVSAVSSVYLTEGGGKTFELLASEVGNKYMTRVPLDTGTVIKIGYKYSDDDNVAVPGAESHSVTLPADWGEERHPPFQW